jgi:hypothetical protein
LTEAGDERLRKEWKEIKVGGPRDNPHGIAVYKLPAKDGRGAWFARRSVHRELDFQRWKEGLKSELAEGLKMGEKGNVRGIGAERIVEHVEPGHGTEIQGEYDVEI